MVSVTRTGLSRKGEKLSRSLAIKRDLLLEGVEGIKFPFRSEESRRDDAERAILQFLGAIEKMDLHGYRLSRHRGTTTDIHDRGQRYTVLDRRESGVHPEPRQ
jgi:hypothetical protein